VKPPQTLTVAGLMSGTSADGIDVAVVRIAPRRDRLKLDLLVHQAFPFPRSLRQAILAAMNAQSTSAAELARLNWRLGIAYAEAARAVAEAGKIQIDLIGCHGQTIYHH
jgi:anhydro-N-acetylmuramic acid kinase